MKTKKGNTEIENTKKSITKEKKASKNNPCWDNYEQAGMKIKNGKKVPNCIAKNN